MSNGAAAQVVSLDNYRRARTERMQPAAPQIVARNQAAPAVWVYWVPVWIW